MLGPEIKLRKEFKFDSAHHLNHYQGKCANVHGHRFKMIIEISSNYEMEKGFKYDFGDIKQIVNEHIVNKLDHQDLNRVLPYNPTAENICLWCMTQLYIIGYPVSSVTIYETEENSATLTREAYITYMQNEREANEFNG
jgi:6-pyruvoyltetrahydropterin/6-carboxytetrahydropterin synthase